MTRTDSSALPNLAEILAPLLARVPHDHQPLFLAIAERMAADRYRTWAREIGDQKREPELLACAAREEEIARRIEELYPEAFEIQSGIRANNPDLAEIDRTLFANRPRSEQLTIQAQGEHLGAATWRAFAQGASGASPQVFLACAELEEASARVVEAILAAQS